MTITLFKKVDYSLSKLIEDIEMGEIGLPDIQRPFVWKASKVRDLFDSMYKGFPVGYLLFWENLLTNGNRQIGADNKQKKISRLLIVDGQQRLTSLYAVLKGKPVLRDDYSEQKITIAFKPADASFSVTDATIQRNPEYIQDISLLWAGQIGRKRFVEDFIAKLRLTRPISEAEDDYISEAIDRLYDLRDYPFTALELSANIPEEQVSEVFVRINSAGVTLNQADFILTLMSVFWDEGRRELESFCRSSRLPSDGKPSPYNHFIKPDPDQMLRVSVGLGFRRARLRYVYYILRGKDLETEKFSEALRIKEFDTLKTAQTDTLNIQYWRDFLNTLVRAGYRSESMISSQIALLFAYVYYLIGKRDFNIGELELREVMARWFFMISLTARYSFNPEGRMEEDLTSLRNITNGAEFINLLNGIITDTLTEDFWKITLPNDLATSSARSPGLFAYNAAQNLLDARALFSKLKVAELLDPAIVAKKAPLERHHLFPKAYLKKVGITDNREINQIANFTLVEWQDNIDILDEAPTAYVPKYKAPFSDEELQKMHLFHALPDHWETMSYEDFLVERRKLMANVIRMGFEQLGLPKP